MAFDPLPQARVVRKAGQLVAPPRMPRVASEPNVIVRGLRDAVQIALGMWPLTAVLLLMIGFLIMAGNGNSHPYHR
jgi:hypothetical protein